MRFFETLIPISFINCSINGQIIMIASRESDRIFVCSQKSSEDFTILGFVKMDGYILSLSFAQNDGKLYAATVLSNNLVQMALLPTAKATDRMKPLPEEEFKKFVRKVDRGANMILTSSLSNKIFVSGEDRYLK